MKSIITLGETNQQIEKEANSIYDIVKWIEKNLPELEKELPEGQEIGIEFYSEDGKLLPIDY